MQYSKYLDELVRIGLLFKPKLGEDNYFLNDALYKRLLNVNAKPGNLNNSTALNLHNHRC